MNKKIIWIIIIAVLLMAGFLVFITKSISQNKSILSQDDVRTLKWLTKVNPLDYSFYNIREFGVGRVKFMNGYYKFNDGYAYIENRATGELDSDSIDETVTMKFISNGGTGKYPELVVLKKDGEIYSEVASTSQPDEFFYDRIYVQSIEIKSKIITVKILGHGPNDPLCCPNTPMEMNFRLVDNKIEVVK